MSELAPWGPRVLVDTSVWIDFLRGAERSSRLRGLLEDDRVVLHPWVAGELALGHLGRRRTAILADLARLPTVEVIADDEVRKLVEIHSLWGSGIGWVDAHLLGAALVSGCELWTSDRRLRTIAAKTGVGLF